MVGLEPVRRMAIWQIFWSGVLIYFLDLEPFNTILAMHRSKLLVGRHDWHLNPRFWTIKRYELVPNGQLGFK
jgi:hypothetical protein